MEVNPLTPDQSKKAPPKDPVLGTFSKSQLELTGKNANISPLHTFQDDLSRTIKSGEGSLVKIAMAENEKRQREKKNVDPASVKNIAYIIGGILLLIVALGAIGYILYLKIPKIVPVTRDNPTLPTIIQSDTQNGLNVTNITRDNLREMIGKEYANVTPKLNTVEQIFLFTQTDKTQHLLTTEEFFTTLESSIPPELLRSLDPTFTLGVHAFNGNGMFLAFHTDSYTNAFAGMLKWETYFFDEFYKMFNISVLGDRVKLFDAKFKDKIIKNQDARAIVDETGKTVLFYTFLGEDKSIIIIADKESTLTEVLNRLTANPIRK